MAYDLHGTPADEVASETDLHSALRARKHGGVDGSTTTVVVECQEVADPITAHEQQTYTHEGSGNFRTRNLVVEAQEPLAFDLAQVTHPANFSDPQPGDPVPPLHTNAQHFVAIEVPEVAHALRGEGHDASEDGTGRGTPLIAGTLTGSDGGDDCESARVGHLVIHAPEVAKPLIGGGQQGGDRSTDLEGGAMIVEERVDRFGGDTDLKVHAPDLAATLVGGTTTAANHGKRSGSDRDTMIVEERVDRFGGDLPFSFKIRGGAERDTGARGSKTVGRGAGKGFLGCEEAALTLGASGDMFVAVPGAEDVLAFNERQATCPAEGVAPTLGQGAPHGLPSAAVVVPAIGFDGYYHAANVELHHTLKTHRDAHDFVAQGVDLYNQNLTGDCAGTVACASNSIPAALDLAPALTASNDPSRSPQSEESVRQIAAVHAVTMVVRSLTPLECERLQGFPDGYTLVPTRKRKDLEPAFLEYLRRAYGRPDLTAEEGARLAKDGARYKALGNSMAVPVMAWIGARLDGALRGESQQVLDEAAARTLDRWRSAEA